MTTRQTGSQRVVIIGGGIAGLATAARLAQSGLPVTLCEASELGSAASTRNQGWLHSGGLFAPDSIDYARVCHTALQETLRFCPDCLEPQIPSMVYLFSRADTLVKTWTDAWTAAGIHYENVPVEQVAASLEGIDRERIQHAFRLPDRAIRADVLVAHLAATAQNAGVEIRTGTVVKRLVCQGDRVQGVETGTGEHIAAQLVILAGGSMGFALCTEYLRQKPGDQPDFELVPLRTHLAALRPEVGRLPFCIVDAEGFNHIPHPPASVFGLADWERLSAPDDHPVSQQVEQLRSKVTEFFPGQAADTRSLRSWAGTMIQSMTIDQIEPGTAIWPAVIDHGRYRPHMANLVSVFSGRATLWSKLADDARRLVLAKLDVAAPETAHPPWT